MCRSTLVVTFHQITQATAVGHRQEGWCQLSTRFWLLIARTAAGSGRESKTVKSQVAACLLEYSSTLFGHGKERLLCAKTVIGQMGTSPIQGASRATETRKNGSLEPTQYLGTYYVDRDKFSVKPCRFGWIWAGSTRAQVESFQVGCLRGCLQTWRSGNSTIGQA